ncbi:hypothetical protein JCM8547_006232 [Rhodosporidiobolus lusitaniae]
MLDQWRSANPMHESLKGSGAEKSPTNSPLVRQLVGNAHTAHPLLVAGSTAAVCAGVYATYVRYGRRVLSVDDLRKNLDFSPRRLRGTVTSVGDADGVRLFHRPMMRPFLRAPTGRTALVGQTLSIRLAGVDAPELAHFGKPEQPYAREALQFLSSLVLGRRVVVELYAKDRYGRVLGDVFVRPFPYFRRRNVSDLMLQAGYAQVYTQAGAQHGGRLKRLRQLEEQARKDRRGMWVQDGAYESPADYKHRTRSG